jgi:cytochrome c554/c'-like protein
MMQPATKLNVKGDFAFGSVVLGNSAYVLQHQDRKYFITESDLSGKPWQHRIDYTLGNRRFQHYLITDPDGRIIVIRPTWDIVRKQWVDVGTVDNPEELADVQVWNKSCYACHVSGEKKNFDVDHLSYRTTWRTLGVDCESCHGAGKRACD